MKLSQEAVTFLLYQRASYRHPIYKFFASCGLKIFYLHHIMPTWFENRRIDTIAKLYSEEIRAYLEALSPHLPKQCETLLDIGCGIGGVDVFLNDHYKDSIKKTILLDRTELTRDYYTSFRETAAACNSLPTAKSILEINGVDSNSIHTVDVNTADFPVNERIDLCISSIAWGYHFPVETYLKQVRAISHENTVLVIDIRKDTPDYEALTKLFGEYTVAIDEDKHQTIVTKVCQKTLG